MARKKQQIPDSQFGFDFEFNYAADTAASLQKAIDDDEHPETDDLGSEPGSHPRIARAQPGNHRGGNEGPVLVAGLADTGALGRLHAEQAVAAGTEPGHGRARESAPRAAADGNVGDGRSGPDDASLPAGDLPRGRTAAEPLSRRTFSLAEVPDLGRGGPKAKFRANLAALRLLASLEAEDRHATAEEQAVLARYVGWGGLPQAFDAHNTDWATEHAALRTALTPEAFRKR